MSLRRTDIMARSQPVLFRFSRTLREYSALSKGSLRETDAATKTDIYALSQIH